MGGIAAKAFDVSLFTDIERYCSVIGAHVTTCSIAICQSCHYSVDMVRDKDRSFQMRVSDEWLGHIDEWRRKQLDLPSRAEAIRRLVEAALTQQGKA